MNRNGFPPPVEGVGLDPQGPLPDGIAGQYREGQRSSVSQGSTTFIGVIDTNSPFPINPNSFFSVIPKRISGEEVVGNPALVGDWGDQKTLAWNCGDKIPPTDKTTFVICEWTAYRWVFCYNG